MYGPKWLFLLGYGSQDTRHIDFLWVDELSTNTLRFGHHTNFCSSFHMKKKKNGIV